MSKIDLGTSFRSVADASATSILERVCPTAEQVAQARIRAAALHGDHLAVEAAARAYRAAEGRAFLARFVHALRAKLRPAKPGSWWQRTRGANVADRRS
jgi:hypothetical protein